MVGKRQQRDFKDGLLILTCLCLCFFCKTKMYFTHQGVNLNQNKHFKTWFKITGGAFIKGNSQCIGQFMKLPKM